MTDPAPIISDLDALMSEDPLNLSDQDIDKIIAYQRQQRAHREAGIKPKKNAAAKTGKVKIDLQALGLIKAPAPVAPGKGIRRI